MSNGYSTTSQTETEQSASERADMHIRTMSLEKILRDLTPDERALLTCALAGNHPPKYAHLRVPMLRALARADGLGRRS